MGARKLWGEANSRIVVGYRPLELILVVVGASPAVIRERIARVQADSRVVVGYRPVVVLYRVLETAMVRCVGVPRPM